MLVMTVTCLVHCDVCLALVAGRVCMMAGAHVGVDCEGFVRCLVLDRFQWTDCRIHGFV